MVGAVRDIIVWGLLVNAAISQEDTRLLRRTLVEKRPVIENKLLTGRQLLASETAPSDTSDSDSEYRAELSTDLRDFCLQ